MVPRKSSIKRSSAKRKQIKSDIYAGIRSIADIKPLHDRLMQLEPIISSFSPAEKKFYKKSMTGLGNTHLSERVVMAETLVNVIISMRTYSKDEREFFDSMLSSYKGKMHKIYYMSELNTIILRARTGEPLKKLKEMWEEDTLPSSDN